MHSTGVRSLVLTFLSAAALFAVPAPAAADITAFLAMANKPANRVGTGLALGLKFLVVGVEFEYATINEKTSKDAPQLRTGMVNALVQTPTSGAQLYATLGGGVFREKFLGGPQETNTAINLGGGVKLGLVGPVKLRVDYRLFKLRGDAVHKTVHRVYAGLNAGF